MNLRWISLICLSLSCTLAFANGNEDDGKVASKRRAPIMPLQVNHLPQHNQISRYHGYNYGANPGGYSKNAYGGPLVYMGRPYSPQSVYMSYLSSPAYGDYQKHCVRSYGQAPKISEDILNQAFEYAHVAAQAFMAAEEATYRSGHYLNVSHHVSGGRSQLSGYLRRFEPMYRKESEALIMEFATKFLLKHYCLSKYDAAALLPNIRLDKVSHADKRCYSSYGAHGAQQLKCNPHDKYRTIDGSCNNLVHKYWGKSFVCHLRLALAAYDDGVSHPRTKSVTGGHLPGAREVSSIVLFPRTDRSYYTHMKMQWGQYVNHDITNTPTSTPDYQGLLECCPHSNHPQCFPISVPHHDYQATKYNKKCLNFVRSAPCPLCTLGVRQQINVGTSFIDNSAIYGSTPEVVKRLRTFHKGLLKTSKDCYGNDIPPQTTRPYHDQCSSATIKCFDSGDPRINQHPGISWMHTVFIRSHNYHASRLHEVNKHWDDEKLFQEARRITISELQYITYNEYLPIVFGPVLYEFYGLDTRHKGFSYYEPHTDPTSWNDYAAAACRFGHSQISSFFSLIGYKPKPGHNYNYKPHYNASMKGYLIRDYFFDPVLLRDGWFDAQTRGFLLQNSETVDPWITEDIHNYLYRTPKERSGGDLPANNIQRGRDHGLPPYLVYVETCFGMKLHSWKDLELLIPKEQIEYLRKVYKHPMDIDLYPGGLSERKAVDADVGPTFACILGVQYYHLKFGDRFFFSHGHQSGSFTLNQLENIKKHTCLASLLCKTADHLEKVQKNPFLPPSDYNQLIPCKSIPDLDYNLWREKPAHPY